MKKFKRRISTSDGKSMNAKMKKGERKGKKKKQTRKEKYFYIALSFHDSSSSQATKKRTLKNKNIRKKGKNL